MLFIFEYVLELLELNGGIADKIGLNIGDKIIFLVE